jgi:FkbM family methyltransferase
MGNWLTSKVKQACVLCLEQGLSRNHRATLARQLLDRANGDNNYDLTTNGESTVAGLVRRRLSGRPSIVFDVGANVGLWTQEFLSEACPLCTVYCFEPSRYTFRVLRDNVRVLGTRVTAVNAALGERDGTATLHIYRELPGTNSLFRRQTAALGMEFTDTEDIVLTRGDSFCRDIGFSSLDFFKIDTEGNELAVLRGFGRMLSEAAIACIQFEYGGAWIDAREFLANAFELLTPAGYTLGKVFSDGVRFFQRYDPRLETFQCGNYLAVQPEWLSIFPPPG